MTTTADLAPGLPRSTGTATSRRRRLIRTLRRQPGTVLACVILAVVIIAAIAAPIVAPSDPNRVAPVDRLLGPGTPGHLLGTDSFGRDLFSRVIWGGRISLLAGFLPALAAMLIGLVTGLIAGYMGGPIDAVINGLTNVLLAFPFMLLAIILVAALGPSLQNAMLALVISVAPARIRLIRGEVLSWSSRPFVDAARLLGYGPLRIMFREILVNVLPLALAMFSIDVAIMMVATAGLSFLGLGVQPPDSDWGNLISAGKDLILGYSYVAIIPTLVLTTVALCVALVGDALGAILDVRAHGTGLIMAPRLDEPTEA